MHLMVDRAVVSNIQHVAVLACDQGYIEQSQWLQILLVYYFNVVLFA